MAKEQEGVKDEQFAADSGVTDQSATGQGVEDQSATGDVESQEENKIPLSRLNDEIQKKKAAEAQNQLLRDQMSVMQANPPQQQPQQPQHEIGTYERAKRELGLQNEDYLTEEQRNQVLAHKDKLDQARNAQYVTQLTNQQFIDSHPDYGDAVGRPNVAGQFQVSAELQKIINEKPHLAPSCSTSRGAYEIVMQERKLTEITEKMRALTEHQTEQQVENKTAPMSSAAAGGGGAVLADRDMAALDTPEKVAAMERRVQAGEFD